MRTAFLSVVLAGACWPATVDAQSISLSESQALARLSEDNPRVSALRAGIAVAQADVLAASRWPNPRLTVDRESVAGATEYLTMVSQSLPVSGRRQLEIQSATAFVSATSERTNDEIRRVRADLRLAFAELVAAQTLERELSTSRDRLRGLADVLAHRESAGDAAGFDRLRAEREVLDMEAELATAATNRARAQALLAGFLNQPATSGIVAVSTARDPAAVPELSALVAQAESTRGELAAFRHEADSARFAARAADRRLIPEPEIVAGTKSSTLGAGDIGSVLTVHATVPLFDRGRPERALATAREAQAEARAESFRAVLRGQVEALRAAVIERRETANKYRMQAVEATAQIERIAQVSYDAGERGILELLDAYRLGTSARARQTALDLAVRQAEIELGFATGWESSL